VLENNFTFIVNKTFDIFIKNGQHSPVEPVLLDELGRQIFLWYQSLPHEKCSLHHLPVTRIKKNTGLHVNECVDEKY
jgi:hypothetical protein